MNVVQPIRDKTKLEMLKYELKKTGIRNYLLFLTGLNSGMRVSDVVNLNRDNIRDENNNMREHITIIEQKTGKLKKFPLVNGLRAEMEKYTENMPQGEYLFKSQKGDNKPTTTQDVVYDQGSASTSVLSLNPATGQVRLLNNAAKNIGLEEIGTHTMRKTFGYFFYKQYKDVAKLQKILNHSSPSITLIYIGIDQDEIDESYAGFSI